MGNDDHSNPEQRDAIAYAIANGWRFEKAKGGRAHPFGKLFCPGGRECCMAVIIYSTPKNHTARARQIRKAVEVCRRKREEAQP